jgi:hypothetical protein
MSVGQLIPSTLPAELPAIFSPTHTLTLLDRVMPVFSARFRPECLARMHQELTEKSPPAQKENKISYSYSMTYIQYSSEESHAIT